MEKNRLKLHIKFEMAVFLLGLGFGSKNVFVHIHRFYVLKKVSCMYVKAKGDQSLLISLRMSGKSVKM